MRLSKLPLVTGTIFCAASLALLLVARPHGNSEPDPIHPITPQMRAEASRATLTLAPTLDRVDTEGKTVDLAKLTEKGPAFLVFIMEGCPCSLEAQPFFQRMYDSFGQKVPFVGITDGTVAQGKEWKAHFQMTFPLISDPSKDLMKGFGAEHSAYTALVGRGGKIVQLWPGYDQAMLGEIKNAIAAEGSLPSPELIVSDAPTKPTSGCRF